MYFDGVFSLKYPLNNEKGVKKRVEEEATIIIFQTLVCGWLESKYVFVPIYLLILLCSGINTIIIRLVNDVGEWGNTAF